jgi:Pilus assembly protein, PilO
VNSRGLIIAVLPLVAAALAFWVLVLGPKRQDASDLEAEVAGLQAEVSEQEQLAASAETARKEFPRAYRRVVVLGKAAPEDDDTSSLLVQLNSVAESSGVDFLSLQTEAATSSGSATPPPTPQTPAGAAEESEQQVENVESGAAATPVPATEATAALLPIGAAVGPAGLPVMKYSLEFQGDFFQLADFLAGLDRMVKTSADDLRVRGRLITVDGFELSPLDVAGESTDSPQLAAALSVTTFLTPPDEGLTDGASPTGPAPANGAQPASSAPSTSSTATASTSTP